MKELFVEIAKSLKKVVAAFFKEIRLWTKR